jgi:hypothetical protein
MSMQAFKSQQLRDAVMKGDLGEPIVVTSNRTQDFGETNLITVPRGQVGLVTCLSLQAGAPKYGLAAAYAPSPAASLYGITMTNEAGNPYNVLGFLSYRRPETHFMGTATPTARSAPPGNTIVWKPRYPIVIPSGCTVSSSTLGEWGNHVGMDLVLVDQGVAATLGINVNPEPLTSRANIFGAFATSVAASLIAGRTGEHIWLKDVFIRLQPGTAGANVLRIYQKDAEDEEVDIFRFANDNIVDALDIVFSPDDIFLKAGASLWVETTIANAASVLISMEYLSPDRVDGNCFFACATPAKPGTGATAVTTVTAGTARKIAPAITLYYPKTDSTATLPGRGRQHLVRGVAVSAQKGGGRYVAAVASKVVDNTLFTISQGAAAGEIGFPLIASTEVQTNPQLMPVLYATEHDQNVTYVDDSKNAPCKPDDGGLWINSLNLHSTGEALGLGGSVATADADISAWAFMVWGKTIPTRFRTPALQGE